jgi:hypothetical protein
MRISRWMRNVWDKSCRKNKKKTHFIFCNFFRNSCHLWDSVEKYGEAKTMWRMPFAWWISNITRAKTHACSRAPTPTPTRTHLYACTHAQTQTHADVCGTFGFLRQEWFCQRYRYIVSFSLSLLLLLNRSGGPRLLHSGVHFGPSRKCKFCDCFIIILERCNPQKYSHSFFFFCISSRMNFYSYLYRTRSSWTGNECVYRHYAWTHSNYFTLIYHMHYSPWGTLWNADFTESARFERKNVCKCVSSSRFID